MVIQVHLHICKKEPKKTTETANFRCCVCCPPKNTDILEKLKTESLEEKLVAY
jgi:hypothetical protein